MDTLKARAKTIALEDSLAFKSPELALQWHGILNGLITPEDVALYSQTKRWFTCFECSLPVHVSPGNASRSRRVICFSCARLATGASNAIPKNLSVADISELLAQWDFVKNTLRPENVAAKSNKRVYWLCDMGHSTKTQVWNRFQGKGCHICLEKYYVSKPEKELRDFIASVYTGTQEYNRKKYTYPYELDIVLPSLGLAIEFNGVYYHSDSMIQAKRGITAAEYHTLKKELALKADLRLLYVWEDDWNTQRQLLETALVEAIHGDSFSSIFGRITV